MSDRINRGLQLVAVRLEPDDFEALESFAQQHGLKTAVAGRLLLERVLAGPEAAATSQDLQSMGYREGLRAAKHDVTVELEALLKRLYATIPES